MTLRPPLVVDPPRGFDDSPRRHRPTALGAAASRGAAALACALMVSAAVACGKKGDPTPPPRLIPAQVTDLRVQQTGDELQLAMTYPAVTTGGLPLPSIEAAEIVALRLPAPPSGAPPPVVDPRIFEASAQVAKRLEGAELAAATRGAKLVMELDATPGSTFGPRTGGEGPVVPAAEPAAESAAADTAAPDAPEAAAQDAAALEATAPEAPPEAPAGEAPATGAPATGARGPEPPAPTLLLAVRTIGPRGHASPLSNVVGIAPGMPPAPPGSLTAEPTASGIQLTWTAGAGAGFDAGFDVLRRIAGERAFGDPVAQLGPDGFSHLDATAAFGTRYEYAIRTVARRDPLVESADGPVRAVEYRDVFAPPAPGGLVALAEEGRVRLLWERVEAPDLAGYRLYREQNGGAAVELPRGPGAGTDHTDDQVRAGSTYVYRVTAVDTQDNESTPSEPATAVPR